MIIKIEPYENGGHANSSYVPKVIPDGWAKVPDDMELENFPFGEVIAKKINGVMTVVKWIPGVVPEVEETEPTDKPTIEEVTWDSMAGAIMEGVNEV